MKALRTIAGLTVAALSIAAASPALGVTLANRVFVSQRSGNDANACNNILTPCQTFAGAVVQLNPGGEAIVLDSGGYGPVTITQSLTIEAPPGVLAFIHPPSGDAITISAGATDKVILRGLTLNGGSGNGITISSVGKVYVENCVISGFADDGIWFDASGELLMKDTISRGNLEGIVLNQGRGLIEHCRFEGNGDTGVAVDGSDVTVRDSVCAGNGGDGFFAQSGGAENSTLNVYECVSTNNAVGFYAVKIGTGSVTARAANSSISENVGAGIAVAGAAFESLGNNFVRGNSPNVNGSITVVLGQ
jgi:hypothetical protein